MDFARHYPVSRDAAAGPWPMQVPGAVMNAAYFSPRAEFCYTSSPGRIEIVIPEERGVFEALRQTSPGRWKKARVAGPHVSVLPLAEPRRLACKRASELLVLGLDAAFYRDTVMRTLGCEPPLAAVYSARDPYLRRVGNALLTDFRGDSWPTPESLDALAASVAEHLARCYDGRDRQGAASAGLAPHKVERVRAMVAERLAEPIHVDDLAAAVCLSPFHFARMFKVATGEPPHVFVTRMRMEEARRLLAQTSQALADIATHVGYRTQAHFTGVFHERVGITPRVYRVKSREAAR